MVTYGLLRQHVVEKLESHIIMYVTAHYYFAFDQEIFRMECRWAGHYHYPLCTLALEKAQLFTLLPLE